MGDQYLVISALGPDRPGIVKDLTDFLAGRGANIDDSRMAILGAEFGTMMLVSGTEEVIGKVERDLAAIEAKIGAKTIARRTKSPEDHRRGALRSFVVTAESFDREGIVRAIAAGLHDLGANIVSLETTQWNAPFTGATLFRIELAAEVPQATTMAKVRAKLEDVSAQENLDIDVRTGSQGS